MFEGIGKYILALFIIYLISYVVKKIELAKMFKKANTKPSKAYIPFVCTKELIRISHSDEKLFKLTLIPFVHIYAYIKIYEDMLKTFGQNPKDASLYVFIPMVYFTRLGSGRARVEIHDYDINNEYLEAQNMLYAPVTTEEEKPLYDMTDPGYYVPDKPKEKVVYKISKKNNLNRLQSAKPEEKKDNILAVSPTSVEPIQSVPEIPEIHNEPSVSDNKNILPTNIEGPNTVFTDKSLEPDKRQEKIVEVEAKKEELKNPITENITGRPKMCPKCGAKLAPGAQICFLCGTKL